MKTDNRYNITIKDKIVGYVEGEYFIKSVLGSKHKLRKPPAWAIDKEILLLLNKIGVKRVKIHDRETNETYITELKTFYLSEKGFKITRGHGEQVAVTLNNWTVL